MMQVWLTCETPHCHRLRYKINQCKLIWPCDHRLATEISIFRKRKIRVTNYLVNGIGESECRSHRSPRVRRVGRRALKVGSSQITCHECSTRSYQMAHQRQFVQMITSSSMRVVLIEVVGTNRDFAVSLTPLHSRDLMVLFEIFQLEIGRS